MTARSGNREQILSGMKQPEAIYATDQVLEVFSQHTMSRAITMLWRITVRSL
jgi:hypothetical protein